MRGAIPERKPIASGRLAGLLLVLAAVLLAACSQQAVIDSLATPQERQASQKLIADLGAGRDQDVSNALPPELRDQLAPQLPQMRAFLPVGPGTQVQLIGITITTLNGVRHGYLTYEVDRADRHALVQIGLQSNSGLQVTDFYISRLADTLERLNAFTFVGKSAINYAFLAGAIAAVAISIWAIIQVWRTPNVRRRWVWTIGCLFGFGQFGLNWSTGAWDLQLLYLKLLSAGVIRRGLVAPWEVSFGIPLAAIIFLVRRRKLARGDQSASIEPEAI
jgi:hypothetical protein